MLYSRTFIHTTRHAPREATMASHVLLLRAGCVRMLGKGIYSYLPMGHRAVTNVSRVVREEMDRTGAQEILMPCVQPAGLWRESGRWDTFGPELLRFENREGSEYALGPTHEEVITDIVRQNVRSYRQLGFTLYQVQTKYRDEPRPRAGLLRGREFIMKDAYSFDADLASARASYRRMVKAYARIMTRLGLDFHSVQADTGAIGGDLSHEFQITTDAGEDVIILCDACGYAANVEVAPVYGDTWSCRPPPPAGQYELVQTPGAHTVDEVAGFLGIPPTQVLKTVLLHDGEEFHAALVRGDRELNLLKTARALGVTEVSLAGDEDVRRISGADVGYAGPVGLSGSVATIVADMEVQAMSSFVCGANRTDHHLRGVDLFHIEAPVTFHDLRRIAQGDTCPGCGAPVRSLRGIEGGQTFLLGTLYSRRLQATFLDDAGESRPIQMGCYGIGISRLVAAAVEQHHDDHGIVWPMEMAPFKVHIVAVGVADSVKDLSNRIHEELERSSVATLLDDRKERPGVKFNDADLLGAPVRLVVGQRGIDEQGLELTTRDGALEEKVSPHQAARRITKLVRNLQSRAIADAGQRADRILLEMGMEGEDQG